jgi:alkylation response protein AidB-like acyl-CoA dehydrogenase
MDFSLSADQEQLRDEIAAFARAELTSGAADRDRAGVFPQDLWRKCGERKLPGLLVPAEYGGRGLDPLSATVALEALAYGSDDGGLTFSLCAHLLACAVPLWKHGTDEQKHRYLPGMSDGSLIAANAMTEPGSGSDAFALSTRAEADGEDFRLNGTKTFCTNAPVSDVILVYAATDPARVYHGGITAFLVPRSTRGVQIGRPLEKLGLRTSPMAEVSFENATVTANAVLGRVGGGGVLFAESMDWERICLVATHVGTMQRLLDLAVTHARSRPPSGGEPAGKSQGVSHAIADVKVRLDAARLLVYRAASRLDRARDIGMDASIAKLFASEALLATANSVVQIFGSDASIEGHPAGRALRDAVASTIYSGTSEIQRNIIARWLGL